MGTGFVNAQTPTGLTKWPEPTPECSGPNSSHFSGVTVLRALLALLAILKLFLCGSGLVDAAKRALAKRMNHRL